MLTSDQIAFIKNAFVAAKIGQHPWPDAAACEAVLETGWGKSESVKEGNNLLGIKAPSWWRGGVFSLPTQEQQGMNIEDVNATWSVFSSWAECFRCQMAILQSEKIYQQALSAKSAPEYIQQVSAQWELTAENVDNISIFGFPRGNFRWVASRWSTDHGRASKVLQIWDAHRALLE